MDIGIGNKIGRNVGNIPIIAGSGNEIKSATTLQGVITAEGSIKSATTTTS